MRYGGTLIARYGYDVLGRRIARRVYAAGPNGATVEFVRMVCGGGQVIAETDGGGTVTLEYTWGLGTDSLALIRDLGAGKTWQVGQDALYGTRALVEKASGNVRATWRYRVYGQVLDSASGNWNNLPVVRYRWAGQQYDPETGFYYMRARYYDPRVRVRHLQVTAWISTPPSWLRWALTRGSRLRTSWGTHWPHSRRVWCARRCGAAA